MSTVFSYLLVGFSQKEKRERRKKALEWCSFWSIQWYKWEKMANYSIVEQTVAHLLFVYCVLYVYLGTMGTVKQTKSNKKAQTHTQNAWRNARTFVFVCGRKKKPIQSWNKRKKWLNSRKMHFVWKFLWSRRKTIFIFLSFSLWNKTELEKKVHCNVWTELQTHSNANNSYNRIRNRNGKNEGKKQWQMYR